MTLERQAIEAFSATVLWRISEAADQDGYDGGFVCRNAEIETHGETPQIAMDRFLDRLRLAIPPRRG